MSDLKKIVLLFFLILISISSFCQSESDCEVLLSRKYLKSYKECGITVLEQPVHYDWKDWTVLAGVAATATLSFVYDDDLHNFFDGMFNVHEANTVSQYTDLPGEELFIIPCIAGAYLISAINRDCRLRNASLATLQAFVFTEVLAAGIKVLSCRERPDTGADPWQWEGPFATFKSTSFASGHAMRAFAMATTLAGMYNDKIWVGALAYSLASITSFGRLISKEHWTSDVVIGAALGYFIGRGIVAFQKKTGNIKNVKLEPVITEQGIGMTLKF